MSRLKPLPEIVIANLVTIKLARGGLSWQIGERYERKRFHEETSIELRRNHYIADVGTAVLLALSLAREVSEGLPTVPGVAELLAAAAELETVLASPGEPRHLVRAALDATGVSISETSRRSGLSRTTIQDLLAGRTDPQVSTVQRALAAIAESLNERRKE